MSPRHSIRSDIKYQLLLSFAGLLLIVALTVYPPAATGDSPWRKPVIGSIFSTFCLLGVLAVFSPNKCGKILDRKKESGVSVSVVSNGTDTVLRGHHPTCGKYSAHVFRIGDRTFCAACIGLLVGGLLALAGTVVYFFWDWRVAEYNSLIVLLGVVGVSFGLFQFKVKKLIRLSANIIFVLGTLLILIGIDESIHSLFFDLFVVCLIVFWLFTRISLSQWDHEIICSGCETENCNVREQKNGGG
jgi:peptidoglycan/LPS O-acetylase OafA/YrhL